MTKIKICGVTNVQDARICLEAGVDAIGLNFVGSSVRRVTVEEARVIADAVARKVEIVGVVANMDLAAMRALFQDARIDTLQLHGDESADVVVALLPRAYKAVRIAMPDDVLLADSFPGDDLLVDSKVPGVIGGSGTSFDWNLVTGLAGRRRVTLAGGLTPENVQNAIRALSPARVDVASGVEDARNPRKKDVSRVRAFVDAVRSVRLSKP